MLDAIDLALPRDFSLAQVTCLSHPVLSVDAAPKPLESLGYPVNFAFTHIDDLIEAADAQVVQRLLDRRADPFDEFKVVPN